MDNEFPIFSPSKCDQIFKDLKHPRLKNLNHTEIFSQMMKKFGGTFIFTIPLDTKLKELKVYRITKKYKDLEKHLTDPKSFSYPKFPEKMGRANLKGHPVFYCTISPKVAIHELEAFNEEVYISCWKLKFPSTVNANTLVLHDNYPENATNRILGGIVQDGLNKLFSQSPTKYKDWYKYQIKKFGDLFIIKGEEYYHLSSAIAHRILYDMRKVNAIVPILIYPSATKMSSDFNLAIFPDFADDPNFLELVSVIKYKNTSFSNNNFHGTFYRKAILKSGSLVWKDQTLSFKIQADQVGVKLKSEKEGRLINPSGIRIQTENYDGDLKVFILNNSQSIYSHVENEIRKVGENHDFFNSETKYVGEALVPFILGAFTHIFLNGENCLEALGIKVKYKIEYE